MTATTRSKRKLRESPSLRSGAIAATDQQQSVVVQSARRTAPLQLAVPQLEQYYPGTSIPMDGWFHACKICRCWTAFSASVVSGEAVPLCRRCAPHQRGTSAWDADAVQQQQQQQAITKPVTTLSNIRRSEDAAERPPAPDTASLQELCQSPAFFTDPAGFLSPGAGAGGAAALCRPVEAPPSSSAAGVFPSHSRSHSSSSCSMNDINQQQLPKTSRDAVVAAGAELLLGRCSKKATARTQQQQVQQQQGPTNISCDGATASHGTSSLRFQQLLDVYIPLLQPLDQQQQQQQELYPPNVDYITAVAAALNPDQLISDVYAAQQRHVASSHSTSTRRGLAGQAAAATGNQEYGQNVWGAIASLMSQWHTSGSDAGLPQQQQQQPACRWQ